MDENLLLQLFRICKTENCGAAIDPDEVKITRNGAAIKIKACCNNSHVENWSSSPDIGEGRGKYPVINVELVNICCPYQYFHGFISRQPIPCFVD